LISLCPVGHSEQGGSSEETVNTFKPIFPRIAARGLIADVTEPALFTLPRRPADGRQLTLNIYGPPSSRDDKVFTLNRSTRSMWHLRRSLGEAKDHLKAGDFRRASHAYNDAFRRLGDTVDDGLVPCPLYRCIEDGEEMLRHAALAKALLGEPKHAAENMAGLVRFLPKGEKKPDIAARQANVLRAYNLMLHASSAEEPKSNLYRRALDIALDSVEGLSLKDKQAKQLHFLGLVLSVEIAGRRMAVLHNARDLKKRSTMIKRINELFKDLTKHHAKGAAIELIARYRADHAILLARMGLWGPALENARTLTSYPYQMSMATKELISMELFQPFVDGQRVLFTDEIRQRTKTGFWLKRMRTAIRMARLDGIKDAIIGGGVPAALAFVGAKYIFPELDLDPAIAASASATAAVLVKSVFNGWQTDEAFYAGTMGTFDSSPTEDIADIGRLALRGGLAAAAWTTASVLTEEAISRPDLFMEAVAVSERAISTGAELLAGAQALFEAQTYANIWGSVRAANPGEIAYTALTAGAGALYLMTLFRPRTIERMNYFAWLLAPLVVMLSADLGMTLAGEAPLSFAGNFGNHQFTDRVVRSSIAMAEAIIMMGAAGLVLRENRQALGAMGTLLEAFHPRRRNLMIPLSAAMLTGITSPLGGIMQGPGAPDTLLGTAIQGLWISLMLMPIYFTMSSRPMRFTPFLDGIREGWEDSDGAMIPKRIYETLRGGLDAVNKPYYTRAILKGLSWGIIPIALRAKLGWDTNAGLIAMLVSGYLVGNGASYASWSERSSTRWERMALANVLDSTESELKFLSKASKAAKIPQHRRTELKGDALSSIHRFFSQEGQLTHPLHPFMRHASLADRFYPLYSFTLRNRTPGFPRVPNKDLFANFHQMLIGAEMTAGRLETVLEYLRFYSKDSNMYEVIRPALEELAVARERPIVGDRIKRFFEEESWIKDVEDLDVEDYEPVMESSRRLNRARARDAVAVSFSDYESAVDAHGRQGNLEDLLEGLYEMPEDFPTDPTADEGADGKRAQAEEHAGS